MATVPSPRDDATLHDPLECPPLSWGIMGCGRVSHDFCQALKLVPSAKIVACATGSSLERAQTFADKHGISKAHGDYESLLKNEAVDIVYCGNVHSFRRRDGEQCLLAGKHVLLEKPFACSVEDAKYLIALAKERDLFLMEGMWTRFFPAFEKARELVDSGAIGAVVNVASDFNFNAADSEAYPDSFVYQRKLGGGASLLTGPYPISAALAFFQSRRPAKVHMVGQVDAATGVDLQAAVVMNFTPTEATADPSSPQLPGAGVATLSYGMVGESKETTTVVGTKGRLTIESPAHCPTGLTVEIKGSGRGQAAGTTRYDYPLPENTPTMESAGGFFYPNSAGFCYEAAAVARCIAKRQCPQFTLDETLICQEILEQARAQLKIKSVHEE